MPRILLGLVLFSAVGCASEPFPLDEPTANVANSYHRTRGQRDLDDEAHQQLNAEVESQETPEYQAQRARRAASVPVPALDE